MAVGPKATKKSSSECVNSPLTRQDVPLASHWEFRGLVSLSCGIVKYSATELFLWTVRMAKTPVIERFMVEWTGGQD